MATVKNSSQTQWRVAVIGFLLVSVVLLIPVLTKPQEFRSHAASQSNLGQKQSVACHGLSGKIVKGSKTKASCQNPTNCKGGSVDGYCPGGEENKCCVISQACEAAGGKCVTVGGTQVKGKSGSYISNLCPGPSNVKCFVEK